MKRNTGISARNGLVGMLCGPVFASMAFAQAASSSEAETEAMARAKRDAEKVFSWIRKDGEVAAPQGKRKPNDDADAPAPKAAPKPPVAKPPPPRAVKAPPAAASAAAPTVAKQPDASAASAKPQGAPAPTGKQQATPAVPAATATATATKGPELPPALFDFEKNSEGFTANDGYKWGPSAGAELALVDKAMRGAKALQVKVVRDSWVGRDLESEDWGGKAYVVFALHSERGYVGKVGFKTGPDWSWCDAKAVASGESKGFTIYRVALESKLCPSLDRRDVRGMHLWINGGDTVTLDNFHLTD